MSAARRAVLVGAGASLGATLIGGTSAQAADFTVSNLNDSGPGSLRQAILDASSAPGADRILFQSTLSGQITLGGELTITDATEVLGPGPDRLTISGNNSSGIFYVNPTPPSAVPVTISGLRLTAGSADGGGAIHNKYANLTVSNAVISGNKATAMSDGGGILNQDGGLTVRSSTVSGNSAESLGGGIYSANGGAPSQGTTIESSTIAGNSATIGGGGAGLFDFGGDSPLSIRNSTISGNSTPGPQGGGGILTFKASGGTLTMLNTIVADNTAPEGPDVRTYGSTTVDATFSLIENPSGANLTGGPTITGQDPKLLPLADNGGPTPTQALDPGSPALDQGQASGVDQRGVPRPFKLAGIALAGDNDADIGAYERVLCGNVLVNKIGTEGNDQLFGSPGPDGILALGGNDIVAGLAGADGICGGAGRDRLKGGAGKDKLLGDGGKDKLKGGKGNDKLKGGPGADILIGGKGKDKLKGGKGKDKEKQ
jgi:Ca2+-binding RTX toxin-like protein